MSGAGSTVARTGAARLAGLAVAVLAPAALAAPHVLSEAALDQVGAGAADAVAGVQDPSATTTPVRRDIIAVGNATVESQQVAAVTLSGDAQRGLRAAGVANVADSDLISAINVSGSGASAAGRGFTINQHNGLTQLRRSGALLPEQWLPDGPAQRRESAFNASGSTWHHRNSDVLLDRSSSHRIETQRVNVQVPGFSPARDWEVDLDLGTMPVITVPGFGFDWTAGGEPFRFGVAADFSSFGLGGAGLSLGTIRADGDDLIIRGGSITLPEITLPSVQGELCAFTCFGGTVSGTRIESQTLSLDVGDIRLAGANPFKDIDLQLGQGIAAVGSGTFEIHGIGATVTAELSFELPSLGGQSITLDLLPSLDFMSDEALAAAREALGAPPSVTIELPEVELPSGRFTVDLVDLEAPTYAGSFGVSGQMEDAVLCLALMSTDCGQQSISVVEVHSDAYQRTTFHEESRSEWEEHSASGTVSERPGARVDDLEAELVVLATSELEAEDYRVVTISGNAQRELRTISLANATTALVGSAANVLGTARPAAGGSAGSRVSQSNVFVQGFQ